jgi:hypothetical protein
MEWTIPPADAALLPLLPASEGSDGEQRGPGKEPALQLELVGSLPPAGTVGADATAWGSALPSPPLAELRTNGQIVDAVWDLAALLVHAAGPTAGSSEDALRAATSGRKSNRDILNLTKLENKSYDCLPQGDQLALFRAITQRTPFGGGELTTSGE